jgi:CPA2 family monovalent cation:H+ antiporter-2
VKGDPVFLLELGAILLLLGAAGALAWRIGLSAVPLFLLAGLLVGEGGLMPAPRAEDFLNAAATIGLVLLLLALGLEFTVREFSAALKRHAPSGLVDLLLNAAPGAVAGVLLGLQLPGVLALAGVTWISSSGIIARTLADLGRLGYRETPAVLSVLVLEDVAMTAYLPLLAVLLAGGTLVAGATGALLAVLVVLAVIALSRWSGPLLARALTHSSDEQVMLRLLGLTLLVAGGAELLGVSSAVGAFLLGLAVPPATAASARRVLAPLRDLFGAAFFLSFGYAIDPASIPPILPAALALAAVSAVTKVATGWYAAGRDGVAVRGRLRAGTALVARGEFSIVIAGLAVSSGVPGLGPLATAYVLVLAVGGPVLTRLAGQRRDPRRTLPPAGVAGRTGPSAG